VTNILEIQRPGGLLAHRQLGTTASLAGGLSLALLVGGFSALTAAQLAQRVMQPATRVCSDLLSCLPEGLMRRPRTEAANVDGIPNFAAHQGEKEQ
jgi:hypothetical protein